MFLLYGPYRPPGQNRLVAEVALPLILTANSRKTRSILVSCSPVTAALASFQTLLGCAANDIP